MARFHEIEVSIWEDLQGKTKDEKILYIYAFSNSAVRDSGLYKIGLDTIKVGTGLRESEIRKALQGLHPKLAYDFEQRIMYVAGKFKRRLSGIHNNKNVLRAIEHDLEAFKNSFVLGLFLEKYKGALEGLKSLSLPLPLTLPLTKREVVGEKEKPFDPAVCEQVHKETQKILKTIGRKK